MNKFVVFLAKLGKVVCRPFFPGRVFGEKNIENKKCLIVGNHISGWDPIIYTLYTKNVMSFVYKAEFNKSRFLNWVFEGLEFVPVKRGEVDLTASKSILRLLKNDKAVCLFPEGTRNPNVDCLQPFHTGAALFALKTHAPIRPFYIWDKTKAFRKNYLIIGDEFTLEEFYDKPITRQTLEEATAIIQHKVEELRIQLNTILDARGVKRRPRTKKELAKLQAHNDEQSALSSSAADQISGEHDPDGHNLQQSDDNSHKGAQS